MTKDELARMPFPKIVKEFERLQSELTFERKARQRAEDALVTLSLEFKRRDGLPLLDASERKDEKK